MASTARCPSQLTIPWITRFRFMPRPKANELMSHTYSHLYNLPTTGLRFFTVYGPWGRPDMALFKFTKAMIEGKALMSITTVR